MCQWVLQQVTHYKFRDLSVNINQLALQFYETVEITSRCAQATNYCYLILRNKSVIPYIIMLRVIRAEPLIAGYGVKGLTPNNT